MEPKHLSRRAFLVGSGVGVGAIAATAWLRPTSLLHRAASPSSSTAHGPTGTGGVDDRIIVHVFLRGAADGLSFLTPVGDATLQRLRPGVAVPDEIALPVGGGFGLHPAFATVHRLHTEGRAAFIPAAGSPSSIRSHFQAQASMDHGTVDGRPLDTGWLGRYLALTSESGDDALRGLSIGTAMQPSLAGGGAIAAPGLASMTLQSHGRSITAERMRSIATEMYSDTDHDLLRSAGSAGVDVLAELAPITTSASVPDDWPTGFGTPFWSIAELIVHGYPIEIATVDLGGWDLHHDMGAPTDTAGAQYELIASLDRTLDAFFTRLGDAASRTTVLITTEFGRRIALNGSGGTDHGRGMVMMAIGAGVEPGVHGDWPGLDETDAGDVRVVNDYRRVYAEVLGRLGRDVDLSKVFPAFDTSPQRRLGITSV